MPLNTSYTSPTFVLVLMLSCLLSPSSASQFCNSTSCFPCHYRCLSCLGPLSNECSVCTQNYLLSNGTCSPCSQNCLSCFSSTMSSTCQTCASGFYLSQSTNSCLGCPQGALSCTFSAVQQCMNGYYLLHSVCYLCISNCLTCSNAYSCSLCDSGYYLTTLTTCSPCSVNNCASCFFDGTCSLCASGYHGTDCSSKCAANCEICDSNACYLCSQGYTINAGGCQAIDMLCATGPSYSSCYQCLTGVAFSSAGACLPYRYLNSLNWQEYYTPLNNPTVYNNTLSFCQALSLYYSDNVGSIRLSFSVGPSYSLRIRIQTVTLPASALTLSSPLLSPQHSLTVQGLSGYNCSGLNLTLSNFALTFTPTPMTPLSSYPITLSLSGPIGEPIGVSQLLVEEMPCGVSNCGICSSTSTCSHCLTGYNLQNNLCLSACSQGYYLTSALRTCSLSCPPQFYPQLSNYLCLPCLSPCLTCSSPTSCLSCTSGTQLYLSSCLPSCPSQYYSSSSVCLPCRYPCSECSGGYDICTGCSLGYLSVSRCLMECPAGWYANVTTLSCHICSSSCLTCNMSPTLCTSCLNSTILQPNSSCLPSCDLGRVSIGGVCLKCLHPCSTCSHSISSCLSCSEGYLFNNSCLSICPATYYADSPTKSCLPCPSSCYECLSPLKCVSCITDSYLYMVNMSCLSSCPSSHYHSSGSCLKCPQPCATCSNSTNCMSCQGYLFVLHASSCLLTCPSGTFLSLNTNLIKTCSPCNINCTTCLSATQCIACTNSTYLQQGECLLSCSSGWYPLQGQGSYSCSPCLFPCLLCSAADLCVSCQMGYYFDSSSLSCLATCSSGFYSIGSNCFPCNSVCDLCRDNLTTCIQCASGYFMSAQSGECLAVCEIEYYGYSPQRSCRRCSGQCLGCLSSNTCSSCQTSGAYPYLQGGSCLASCPSGYYSSAYQCLQCSSECNTCNKSSNLCTSCSVPFLYTASLNSCTSACLTGFYEGGAGVCLSCPRSCVSCSSPSFCKSCSTGKYLLAGDCLSVCPNGYYSSNMSCLVCGVSCLSCSLSAANCSSCVSGSFLLNGSCISKCPALSYPDATSLSCLFCVFPCLLCHSSSSCLTCASSYLLFRDSCLLTCPSTYYSNDSHCIACLSPCSTCISASSCTACVSGYFLEKSLCLSTCPSHTYVYQTSNGYMQCLACSPSCLECYDGSACKSCYLNSTRPYLQGLQCLSTCTDGYYTINSSSSFSNSYSCLECGQHCLTCINSSHCLQCSGAFLLKGVCSSSCPSTYYPSLANTCEMCLSPCLVCYDGANCLSCMSSYYLYLTHCLPQCPPDTWTVTSPNICNSTCLSPYFKLSDNRRCSPSCSYYHSTSRQCLYTCPNQQMANRSYGCQECAVGGCRDGLYYQVVQQQLSGVLRIKMVFSMPIDSLQSFTTAGQNSLTVVLQTSQSPTQQQLDMSVLRVMQQLTPTTFSVFQADQLSITIEPVLSSTIFSGIVHLTVTNLSVFTSDGYPLQATNSSLAIQWYQPSPPSEWSQYLSYLLSAFFLICLLINAALDNSKVMVPLADCLQTLHYLFYLDVWSHPAVLHFMLGLQSTALRIPLLSSTGYLWDCSSKTQLVYGNCSLYGQLLIPLIILFMLTAMNFLLSKIIYFQGRKWLSWGHVYIYWWVCFPSIGLSALTYTSSRDSSPSILISAAYGCLFLALAFQIVKNVYNKSYAERTFFWNLRKRSGEIANLHVLLVVVRRVCLIVGLGAISSTPLGILFMLTLLTVYIISNLLINKPIKKMSGIHITSEVLMGVFLLLLQMAIINATTFNNQLWNALGYIMLLLAFTAAGLLSLLTAQQTVSCIKKHIIKIKGKAEQSHHPSQEEAQKEIRDSRSSQISKKSQDGLIPLHVGGRSIPRGSNSTQQEFLRINSEAFTPKNKEVSEGFSDIFEGVQAQGASKAAPKLIKLSKETSSEPMRGE